MTELNEADVEAVARAICAVEGSDPSDIAAREWDDKEKTYVHGTSPMWKWFEPHARAAIAAIPPRAEGERDLIPVPREVDIECAIGGKYDTPRGDVWVDGPIAREAARRVMAMLAANYKDWSDASVARFGQPNRSALPSSPATKADAASVKGDV